MSGDLDALESQSIFILREAFNRIPCVVSARSAAAPARRGALSGGRVD
jgi:hypothetical protein